MTTTAIAINHAPAPDWELLDSEKDTRIFSPDELAKAMSFPESYVYESPSAQFSKPPAKATP